MTGWWIVYARMYACMYVYVPHGACVSISDNVNIALNNVDNLNEMEEKSDRFENQARQFQKSSCQRVAV